MTIADCMACEHTTKAGRPKILVVNAVTIREDQDLDECLLPELEALRDWGVRTTCSCCGHGDRDKAFVVVQAEDREKMIALGYEERPPKWDHCKACGVFFRARTISVTPPVIRRRYREGDERDYMYDVKLTSTARQTACGPASLRMLLGYYGIDVALEELIAECDVRVDGSTAGDLMRAARAHGMTDVRAYRTDAGDVLRMDRPAILFWRHNHFVVFCGLNDKGEPVIANPAIGRYAIDAETFGVLYSGVALCNGAPSDAPGEDWFNENEPDPDYFHD